MAQHAIDPDRAIQEAARVYVDAVNRVQLEAVHDATHPHRRQRHLCECAQLSEQWRINFAALLPYACRRLRGPWPVSRMVRLRDFERRRRLNTPTRPMPRIVPAQRAR